MTDEELIKTQAKKFIEEIKLEELLKETFSDELPKKYEKLSLLRRSGHHKRIGYITLEEKNYIILHGSL